MVAGDVDVQITKLKSFNGNMYDGVDDYTEVAHNTAQLGANLSNGFTISAWINPRSSGETNGNIISKSAGTSGQNGFYFIMVEGLPGNGVNFRINGGTSRSSGANSIIYGTWQHVLVTISSAQLANFYINGVLSGTANQDLVQTISTITTTNAMRIGNRATATDRTFDGSIRSVKMWRKVLTTTEITADYNEEAVAVGDLIHNFKLGGDYKDYGFVGVEATNSGSIPTATEDRLAPVVKTQRATAGASGKFLFADLQDGQIISAAISE